MAKTNPKLIIIQYYDRLINFIDIHTEELLQKYSETDLLEESSTSSDVDNGDRKFEWVLFDNEELKPYKVWHKSYSITIDYDIEPSSLKTLSTFTYGSNRMCDYLNATRYEMIKYLQDAQKKTMQDFELIKNDLKLGKDESESTDEDDLVMSRLFANRYHFVVKICENKENKSKIHKYSPFKLLIVDLDFYLDKIGKLRLR